MPHEASKRPSYFVRFISHHNFLLPVMPLLSVLPAWKSIVICSNEWNQYSMEKQRTEQSCYRTEYPQEQLKLRFDGNLTHILWWTEKMAYWHLLSGRRPAFNKCMQKFCAWALNFEDDQIDWVYRDDVLDRCSNYGFFSFFFHENKKDQNILKTVVCRL